MTSAGDQSDPGPILDSGGRLSAAFLDQSWDFDNPAASERRFRAAIADVPFGSSAHAELTTQLARAIGLQGRYD